MSAHDEAGRARPSVTPLDPITEGDIYVAEPHPCPTTRPTSLRPSAPRPTPPTRRDSTKALVSRFEALSVPISAATTPATAPRRLERAPSGKALPSLPPVPDRSKAHAAIHKSWQNLLGVLSRKDASDRPPQRRKASTQAEVNFTGPILVLTEDAAEWIACMAKLRSRDLHVTPDHDDAALCPRVLSLVDCIDVRSLSQKDLDEQQRNTLAQHVDGDGSEPKVFEVVFVDRTIERFAAASIQARAVWVSTLWDAILQAPISKLPKPASPVPEADAAPKPTPAIPTLSDSPIPARPFRPPPGQGSGSLPPTPPRKDASRRVFTPPRLRAQSLSVDQKRPSLAALSKRSSVQARVGQLNELSPEKPVVRRRAFAKPSEVTWRTPQLPLAKQNKTPSPPDTATLLEADTDSLLEAYQTSSEDERSTLATSVEHAPSQPPTNDALFALADEVSALRGEIARMARALPAREPAPDPGGVTNAALAAELLRVAQGIGELRRAVGGDVRTVHDAVGALERRVAEVGKPVPVDLGTVERKLEEITKLVLDGQATAKAGDEQQAENGRYLAQMCSWLDAFVKYSTSNQEQMTVTLEQLLVWLQANSPQGTFITEDPQLTNPARGLGVSVPVGSATLTQGMNQLITTVQTSLGMDARARDTLYHALLQQLPERQRRDQTEMLQTLAAELSTEIRGERLRFVDAMKEATTLNVHLHVEQFKSHLNREVHVMTQEVVRLQRERDLLEQRIGELRRVAR